MKSEVQNDFLSDEVQSFGLIRKHKNLCQIGVTAFVICLLCLLAIRPHDTSNQVKTILSSLYLFFRNGNWGNTLFSAVNFGLVFFAWFRIGKSDSLPFNYMKHLIKPGEKSIFRLWFVGQLHAILIFGFLLDNIRTLIGFNFMGLMAVLLYIGVIWIGKDNQALHLNLTRELAHSYRFINQGNKSEIELRQNDIEKLQKQIVEHEQRILELNLLTCEPSSLTKVGS